MKKAFFIPVVLLGIIFLSCNNEAAGPSVTTKKNLDAAHGIQKAFETKDFSKLGDFFAADAVDHAGDGGDVKGLANLKTEFEKWSGSTENDKTTIIKELADDEYVMSWLQFNGTMKISMMGHKAGDKFDMKSVELSKFKDGKIIEHWSFMDSGEMMKMMSSMQPSMTAPLNAIKADTVKMK